MSERNSRLMSIGEVAKSLHITRRMILLHPGDPDPHPGHPALADAGYLAG